MPFKLKFTSYRKSSGFSLVELSMVIIIMGIIAGGAISMSTSQSGNVKYTETITKMESIEDALTSYLQLNGRLPCPADPDVAFADVTLGAEIVDGSVCDVTAPDPQLQDDDGSANIAVGSVPVDTLQLPNDFILDGWGRRFTYAVSMNFASSATSSNFEDSSDGVITMTDGTNNRVTNAVLVVISHGPNGYGAWLRNGGSQKFIGGASAAELENNHLTAASTITSYDAEFVQGYETPTFDDITIFKTKEQLVREAGFVISKEICDAAYDVTNAGSGCDSASDSAACQNFSLIIDSICLQ